MTLETLTSFFMWCSIINGGLLAIWTLTHMLAPKLVFRTQKRWFPMPEDTFTVVYYGFLGGFKILFLVFNLIPYIALSIII